jgi:hypothetical protein
MKRKFFISEVSNIKTGTMKCRKKDNELENYFKGSLTGAEKTEFEYHLSECHVCRSRLAFLSDTETFIRHEKEITPNEFLFTRIMARVDSGVRSYNPVKKMLVPLMVASFLFLVAIIGGVSLGKLLLMNHENVSYIVSEENRSLNDLKQEPIENFFLTSQTFDKDE